MPFVQVRRDVCEKMIELRREKLAKESAGGYEQGYATGMEQGFMAALDMFMNSESVGLMVMERECAINGDGSYIDRLPHLVVEDDYHRAECGDPLCERCTPEDR